MNTRGVLATRVEGSPARQAIPQWDKLLIQMQGTLRWGNLGHWSGRVPHQTRNTHL